MESRIRVALHLGGLPAPVVQHPVVARGSRFYLDLAYPHARLAIEYLIIVSVRTPLINQQQRHPIDDQWSPQWRSRWQDAFRSA